MPADQPADRDDFIWNNRERNVETIIGLFDSYLQAGRAVAALKRAGIPEEGISFLSGGDDPELVREHLAADIGIGGGAGAAIGGATALLAGLGLLVIPGIGPAVAGGWLAETIAGLITGTMIGVAAGGLVGALTKAGVPHDHAHLIAGAVKPGSAIVAVRCVPEMAAAVREVLEREGGRSEFSLT
jgi:hypothetical protein